MSHGRNFIPARESEFLAFATVFCQAAATHATVLGIPAELVTAMNAKLTAYTAAYNVCIQPNAGRLDRDARNEQRKILTTGICKLKNAYIDADPLGTVTDGIRLDFGLPLKDPTRSEVPVPTELVPFGVESEDYLQILVTHPAKPAGYNGAVAFYQVGGAVPPDYQGLTQSKLLTRSREILRFEKSQLGQTLYISLRWQNRKGDLGPWAPVQSKVIS